jgi:hypothetical protein
MTDKADHIAWAVEAIAVFQRHRQADDEHAIADLNCDLGHLAEERRLDFLKEVPRDIWQWHAEHQSHDRADFGSDTTVGITPAPR